MPKTILITGSTDGIGLAAAKMFSRAGHRVLLHGRSETKLEAARQEIGQLLGQPASDVLAFQADLSKMPDVERLAAEVSTTVERLDVLINNAGVFTVSAPRTDDGLDVRFVVNTIAPYLLTQRLLSKLPADGRVLNLSSAAQAPVDLRVLAGELTSPLTDMEAYAQSKLAITMWTQALAKTLGSEGPVVVAINPGSMLGTKMVKNAFGVAGGDVNKGADILRRAALGAEFADASGRYFDNDSGRFAAPHSAGRDPELCRQVVRSIEGILAKLVG